MCKRAAYGACALLAVLLALATGAAAQSATCPYTVDNLSQMTVEDVAVVKTACDPTTMTAGDMALAEYCATCACATGTNGLKPDATASAYVDELLYAAGPTGSGMNRTAQEVFLACFQMEAQQYLALNAFTPATVTAYSKCLTEPVSNKQDQAQDKCPEVIARIKEAASNRPGPARSNSTARMFVNNGVMMLLATLVVVVVSCIV